MRLDTVGDLVSKFAMPDVLGAVDGAGLGTDNPLGFLANQIAGGGQPLVRVLERREIPRLKERRHPQ